MSFYPSPPPHHHQQSPRVISSGQMVVSQTMQSYPSPPHSHSQQASQPSASQYPHARYNPALYMSNAPSSPHNGALYGPPGRSAQSPHRNGVENRSGYYNPQDYGNLGFGRVVTPPVQPHGGDAVMVMGNAIDAPPPYSPPMNSSNTTPAPSLPAHRPAPVQRLQTQPSWNGLNNASPSSSSPYQYHSSSTTPSSAAFSPFSATSSQGTTPQSPHNYSGQVLHHKTNYTPPVPTSNLQHQTSFENGEIPPPPPRPAPQQQQGQMQQVPPPPPGPPPLRLSSPPRQPFDGMRRDSSSGITRINPPAHLQMGSQAQLQQQGSQLQMQQPMTPRSPIVSVNEVMFPTMAPSNFANPSMSNTNGTASRQFGLQLTQEQQYSLQQQLTNGQRQAQGQQQHLQQSQPPQQQAQIFLQSHQVTPPCGSPLPLPKRKMSIGAGHEIQPQRVSPRTAQKTEPNNNPWREALQPIDSNPTLRNQTNSSGTGSSTSNISNNSGRNGEIRSPPRQLLTPPPTIQDRQQDLLTNSKASAKEGTTTMVDDELYASALTRFNEAIRKESDKSLSEEKRIAAFLNFVKQEWYIRERRYGEDKLRKAGWTKGFAVGSGKNHKKLSVNVPDLPMPGDGDVVMGNDNAAVNGDTPLAKAHNTGNSGSTHWWSQSNLDSPISPSALANYHRNNPRSLLSAAFGTDIDDTMSRGRTSSRWWETSLDGQSEFGGIRSDGEPVSMRDERQRRRQTKTSLREIAREASSRYSLVSQTPTESAASYMGRAEYPPDRKIDVPAVEPASGIQTQAHSLQPIEEQRLQEYVSQPPPPLPEYGTLEQLQPIPQLPQPQSRPIIRLDILPLLTLLPPYPRIYPAVNNCHPQLASFRNLVRNLNDLEDLHKITTSFNQASQKRKESVAMEARSCKQRHNEKVQRLYQSGKITFEEVDSMDRDFETEENDRKVQELKVEFDLFQREVVDVVHSGLMERIAHASDAYIQLSSELKASLSNPTASLNRMRELEGDEIPELLEKLTLLKWLFDLRESLHREVYELLKDRNSRYKELIVTPFYNARQGNRIREAEEFFSKDEAQRRLEEDQASLTRFNEFNELMEQSVAKGVEIQISSFWDVAPLVAECFEKIPDDLSNVEPIVPMEEAHENQQYLDRPLAYLMEKIVHAERATYQFVEAQTNLLCLLHEVKSSVVRAKFRAKRTERTAGGLKKGESGDVEGHGGEMERAEERKLTEDLKEKVKLLESEWKEAIGKRFEEVKGKLARELREDEAAGDLAVGVQLPLGGGNIVEA